MHRIALYSAVALMASLGLASGAAASHNAPINDRCDYVYGSPSATVQLGFGPGIGGCTWEFPGSGGSTNVQRTIAGEWSHAEAIIVDDVWGVHGVGGTICNDGNGDGFCGDTDRGEEWSLFCDEPGTITSDKDWDFDGHDDFGVALAVFVNEPVENVLEGCGGPTGGTTGGVLASGGGIFLALD